MKKLILLAAVAAGVGVLVKNKSQQLKAGASKVTSDPRVQSALATASEKAAPITEKAAPYAATVKEKAGPVAATVKEKAGPVASSVKDKVADSLHHEDTPADSTSQTGAVAPDPVPEQPSVPRPDPLSDPLPEERRPTEG